MKRLFLIFCGIILGISTANADIFSHPADIKNIAMPQFENVTCKFSQTKTIPNSESEIKSGGDFRFVKEKGVIFETKFPLQMVTSYTSTENKRISSIISAINSKNYSYINQNFNIFYEKNSGVWTLALKPKPGSKTNAHIASIIIKGEKYINRLDINTLKNGSTKINFTECK